MSVRTIGAFESSRQKTNLWLKAIASALRSNDRRRAYAALRAVLHALRDCMPTEEAAKFSAQMPLLVKGVFFDGWKPHKPQRMNRGEFYECIRTHLKGVALDPGLAARAVLGALDEHLSIGEVENVRRMLPTEVREIWSTIADEQRQREPLALAAQRRRQAYGPGQSVPMWP